MIFLNKINNNNNNNWFVNQIYCNRSNNSNNLANKSQYRERENMALKEIWISVFIKILILRTISIKNRIWEQIINNLQWWWIIMVKTRFSHFLKKPMEIKKIL